MNALVQEIISDPLGSLLIVANLFLIESLLSVDNAAVMATMVMRLPQADRKRALRFGLLGAYLFRGLCLFLAAYLVKVWWLKGLGGMYLVYLAITWWIRKSSPQKKVDRAKDNRRLYKWTAGRMGTFWATVLSVELMDLAFSLDNVFAAVAYSRNILIILTGVFIGILAMRFVAQAFVKLMEQYTFLEGCAFAVIGLLGVKLTLSFYEHLKPEAPLSRLLEARAADWITSGITIGIFLVPLVTSLLFGFPKRK